MRRIPVFLLRAYPAIAKLIFSSKQRSERKPTATLLDNKEFNSEVAHVHRCSIDSKHYHLMIHGEALARRRMGNKRVFACDPREQEIANSHLNRLEVMRACLKYRSIIQVRFEQEDLNYAHPLDKVERHFLLTRILNYHSR
ncbi:MAG: hypothetical protein KGZ39_03270 [Simkania sp.]|nr:hypothetical protein [Simkania sp.]